RLQKRTKQMVDIQYRTYRELVRCLAKEGIEIKEVKRLTLAQQQQIREYYNNIVFPVLTPMAVDQSRPFPHIHNMELYLAVSLTADQVGTEFFAIIQVPSILSRFVPLNGRRNSKKKEFVLLEDIIKTYIDTLFSGYTVHSVH